MTNDNIDAQGARVQTSGGRAQGHKPSNNLTSWGLGIVV